MENNTTVILRMTNACNLACKYCYDSSKRQNSEIINKHFLENIDKIVGYIDSFYINKNKRMNLILHGGEPLTLSANVYEVFLKKLTERLSNISISVQTNGTLLDVNKMRILNKYNVKIGISLDGSTEEQNKNRIYKNGRNSFNKVKNTINMLKNNNIKFGVIMTLSKNNLHKEKEIYEFIKENNIYCDIRPAFPTKNNMENSDIMTNDEYIDFFKNFFDIWYNDNTKTVRINQINEIYDEFIKVLEPKLYKPCCEDSQSCFGRFVSVDINGMVYTCNRTYNENIFYLGNLEQNTVEEILKNAKKLEEQRKNKVDSSKCINCKQYKYCYGGCPAISYYLYGDFSQPCNYFCKQKREIYNYVKNKLKGQISKYNEEKQNLQ